MSNFLDIESVSANVKNKVRQSLLFKTGNFVWRVKFNIPLNPKTVNNINLYVTSIKQVPLKTSIKYDTINHIIEIEPLDPYAKNESYILNITRNVQSVGGQNLKEAIQVQFKL